MNRKIGLFDSGLGGLSILKEMLKEMPNEDYLFYEDSMNNPYGEKSEEELFSITSKIVDYLLKEDCKIIVIACNTATTSCMKLLREKYQDTIFVGTVPAIKVAYDHHYKSTIILSTPYTTKTKRVNELMSDFKNPDQDLINVSGENLAHLIEIDDKDGIQQLLDRVLSPYLGKVDSVVLGCTHYSLIKEDIHKHLPGVALLDGCLGVTQEVKRQLDHHQLLNKQEKEGSLTIINTKDDALIQRSIDILNS